MQQQYQQQVSAPAGPGRKRACFGDASRFQQEEDVGQEKEDMEQQQQQGVVCEQVHPGQTDPRSFQGAPQLQHLLELLSEGSRTEQHASHPPHPQQQQEQQHQHKPVLVQTQTPLPLSDLQHQATLLLQQHQQQQLQSAQKHMLTQLPHVLPQRQFQQQQQAAAAAGPSRTQPLSFTFKNAKSRGSPANMPQLWRPQDQQQQLSSMNAQQLLARARQQTELLREVTGCLREALAEKQQLQQLLQQRETELAAATRLLGWLVKALPPADGFGQPE
jgi:hypothetical protein